MKLQLNLPPSARDFEAYRLVKVEQRSTRAVANLLGISQTRICQIIDRVGQFIVEVAPAADDEVQRGKRLHIAEQIAAERLDFLYGQAVNGFRKSCGPQTTNRNLKSETRPSLCVETSRVSFGDCRYLAAAARLALLAAKLPAAQLGTGVMDRIEDVEGDDIPLAPATPSFEACSAGPAEQDPCAPGATAVSAAKRSQETACINEVLAGLFSKTPVLHPVQRPGSTVQTPASAAAPSDSKLLPKQRQAREAFLSAS